MSLCKMCCMRGILSIHLISSNKIQKRSLIRTLDLRVRKACNVGGEGNLALAPFLLQSKTVRTLVQVSGKGFPLRGKLALSVVPIYGLACLPQGFQNNKR